MYRGYRNRKKEAQARAAQQLNTPVGPVLQSSSRSVASSLTSSTRSPVSTAALPIACSRSEILSSDHSVANCAPRTPPKTRFFPISLSPTSRSLPVTHMGQGPSRTDPGSPHSPTQDISYATASATSLPTPSSRLKRIWPGRRKKSEDVTSVFTNAQYPSNKGKQRDPSSSRSAFTTPATSVDEFEQHSDDPTPLSRTKLPLTIQLPSSPSAVADTRSQSPSHSPKSPELDGSSSIPPVPSQSQSHLETTNKPLPSCLGSDAAEDASPPSTSLSPGSAVAIQFMQSQLRSLSPGLRERSDTEVKQDWRKSDSTVLSYVTIRPGYLGGSRSPRPVSLAESSHSGHTIVPVNRRLSALITDAEFVMAEEHNSDSGSDNVRMPVSGRPSPASSVKARNRRSASLNLGSGYFSQKGLAESLGRSATPRLSRTFTDTPLVPSSRDTPTLSRAAASGIMSTSQMDSNQSTPANVRGRLAMWTSPSPGDRDIRNALTPQPRRPTPPTNSTNRQTMSISLAPVALGFGRRAAEKVQRVWEGLSSASSSQPSSSMSGTHTSPRTPSRQSIYIHQPSIPGGWRSRRRTPEASSGSWSIASSIASSSESDAFSAPAGPSLGPCLRGPKRNASGLNIIGGLVFGRDLRSCVQETAIDSVRSCLEAGNMGGHDTLKPVEQRMLPAIIVRCYQHLMTWGVQEEGLFRVPGRASHLAKLRSEFDTGADFDLSQCDPSELDPHAVASIFKAFLRELPQSLFTATLVARFESAIPKDSDAAQLASLPRGGLPQLRKPPSLSTLAMPSFAGQRTASSETVSELASLIAQLPVEHRDLLHTVVELISATAARSKETKMPLGNLMLLFCPTLGVSHALLRVLCEATDIWIPPAKGLNKPLSDGGDIEASVITDSVNSSSSSLSSDTDSEIDISDLPPARPRPGRGRGLVRTMLYTPDGAASPYSGSSASGSLQDDAASYVSALDHSPAVSNDSSNNLPALTTSTDSIATPSTMSEVSSLQTQATGHAIEDENTKDIGRSGPEEPRIVDLSLPAVPRRPLISAPVPFPSSGSSSPQTPSSARKSLSLLSFPPLGKSDSSSTGPGGSAFLAHRPKRPSLTLLFAKRSASSLSSPALSRTPEGSLSNPSSPLHVPMPIRNTVSPVPPVLDTPISSSPIRLFDARGELKMGEASLQPSFSGLLAANETDWHGRERKDSSGSSLFSTPQQTPIADFFRGRSTSLISVLDDNDVSTRDTPCSQTEPPTPTSRNSPTIKIGLGSTMEYNWAESIFEQAQASTDSANSGRQASGSITIS